AFGRQDMTVERLGADQDRLARALLRRDMVDEAARVLDRQTVAVLVGERMGDMVVPIMHEELDLVVGRIPEPARAELGAVRGGEALDRRAPRLMGTNVKDNRHRRFAKWGVAGLGSVATHPCPTLSRNLPALRHVSLDFR